MKIYGLQSGMVMQRDLETGACRTYLRIEDCDCPGVSCGTLEKMSDGRWCLTGIPVGGPYEFTIFDGCETLHFSDIFVGDVWLTGGQSNMQGCGEPRECDLIYDNNPIPQIRAFYMDDQWDAATTRIHQVWLLAEPGLADKSGVPVEERKTLKRGTHSGVDCCSFIGRYLWEKTGVPQGFIPCAYGGTSMYDWSPENTTPTAEYPSMIRRFYAAGGNARGMFWYQGESDIEWMCNRNFTKKMVHLIKTLRTDIGIPTLPVVQAQINTCQWFSMCLDTIIAWVRIQRQQEEMAQHIPYLSTVSTANSYRKDLIHINADGQETLGKTMAMEMLALLGENSIPSPTLKAIDIRPVNETRNAVVLIYENVVDGFVSQGHPYGYSLTVMEETPYLFPYKGIDYISLRGNEIWIVTEYSREQLEHGYVWYGAGPNAICTIQDGAGRYPLVMGPVKICP